MGHRTKRFINRTLLSNAKFGVVLILTVLCFQLGDAAQANDLSTMKTIKVIIDDNYPPYVFRDELGQLQGILIDQWKLWEKKVDIRAELTGMNWAEAQQRMLSSEFDVIDTIFRSEQREKTYDFSEPYASIDVPLYFHSDISGIRGVQDLKGFVVAAKEGDNVIEVLYRSGITNIAEYPSYEMIIEAARSGKIKVFTIDKPAALYFLNKAGIQDLYRESYPLYTGYLHRAVLKGNSQILATVENGFSLISDKEYRAIDRLWMGSLISSTPFFRYFIYLIAVGIAALLFMGIWLWMLKLAVVRKTSELTREINLRKLSEETLLSSEAHLKTLIKTIPDLVWLKDPDGVYLACNPQFERFFGAREAEIVGKTDYDFVDKGLADFFRQHDKAAMAAGKPCVNEEEVVCADDGHRKLLETIKTPMFGGKGQLMGVLGIARDITDRKKAEKEKAILEDKLQQSYKMDAIGTLAGGIAHDFNNLLTIIVGYSELIREDSSNEKNVHQSIQQVQIAADRAKHLVQQILAFSRQGEHEFMPVKLQSIVKESLKLLRASIPTTIEIIQDIDPQCGVVNADPTQINQILMNLCANGVHAMDEKGVLKVTLKEVDLKPEALTHKPHLLPGQYVCLSISDTGTGMNQQMIARIFDPFYTTKEVGKGTGLGLAVVHGIVEGHGGFIDVESEPGRGSTFNVFFPVTKQEEFLGVETSRQSETGTERILLVDDEEDILEMVKRILENLGYEIIAEKSSVKALEIFKSNPEQFDLIITDQSMANMSGIELIAQILKKKPGMPVILCTGYSTKVSAENARAKGISKYLNKPYDKKILAEAVREVLDGKI